MPPPIGGECGLHNARRSVMGPMPIRFWWLLGGAIVVTALLTATATVVVADFNDVPPGSFFEAPVDEVESAGCAAGFPDNSFRPNAAASRGQFALWSANCLPRSMF